MRRTNTPSMRAAVRHVATALLPDLREVAERTVKHIAEVMPELAQAATFELAHAACHANTKALLEALARGTTPQNVTLSAEVMLATRALVQQGITHDNLLRGYRVGLASWCAQWAESAEQHCPERSLTVQVVAYGTTFLINWLDAISDRLSAEYRDEAERVAREGSLAWVAYVRRALFDEELDIQEASLRLGYNLSGRHVAMVLTRYQEDEHSPLDSTTLELARAISSAKPLVVRVDVNTTWCWVPAKEASALAPLKAAVLVGQGRPATGLEGFRRSHHEACEALRVARIAGYPAGSVTRFDDIELAALCSADAAYCRAFVSDQLGPLGENTEDAQHLRETLRVFFDEGSNFRATATRLGLHHNTIRYRLDKVESLLGYSPGKQRLQLELALHLSALFGSFSGIGRDSSIHSLGAEQPNTRQAEYRVRNSRKAATRFA